MMDKATIENLSEKHALSKDKVALIIAREALLIKKDFDLDDYNEVLRSYNLDIVSRIYGFEKYAGEDHFYNLDNFLDDELRSVTGSYYTPVEIVRKIVDMSIADYFGITDVNEEITCEMAAELLKIRIIDIAGGTGVFILEMINRICGLLESFDIGYDLSQLISNHYIADINKDALELFLINLLIRYDSGAKAVNIINCNSVVSDELTESKPIKAVMDEGGFDIVIGNPPYLGEKNNQSLFQEIRNHEFGNKYYEGKMDLFYFFIYRGFELLNESGVLTYITTNYFVTADGARKLRNFLKSNRCIKRLSNIKGDKLFKSALGQHNMIYTLSREANDTVNLQHLYSEKNRLHVKGGFKLDIDKLYQDNNNIVMFNNLEEFEIIAKTNRILRSKLEGYFNINQGIVSGADKVTKTNMKYLERPNLDEGIFVLTKDEASGFESDNIKPFYKNSDIENYFVCKKNDRFILYITDEHELSETSSEYKHLFKYKAILERKRETINGTRNWSSLHWYRSEDIFKSEKIVAPQRAVRNKFAFDIGDFYASADVYYLTRKSFDANYISTLMYLNSKFMYFWLSTMGKKKGEWLELYATPLKQIPFGSIINESDEIISLGMRFLREKDVTIIEVVDNIIYKMLELNDKEIEYIEKYYISEGLNE